MMTRLLLQVCAVSLLAVSTTRAFSVVPNVNTNQVSTTASSSSVAFSLSSRVQNKYHTPLSMAASEGAEDASSEVETTEEAEAVSEEDSVPVDAQVVEEPEEAVVELTEPAEKEEPVEDPELVALKEEIATMEKTLKERRVQVALTADAADEFSSAGYARKVAEMEMMRRNKRVSTVRYYTILL
jgi:hypothetical protein